MNVARIIISIIIMWHAHFCLPIIINSYYVASYNNIMVNYAHHTTWLDIN